MRETHAQEDHPDELTTAVYLDGKLPPDDARIFESHLARCDACRAGIALLRSSGSEEAMPREFIARARQADRPASSERRWLTPPRAAALAASLLMVAALAAYLSPSTPPRSTAPYRGGAGGFEDLVPSAGSTAPARAIVFRWSRVRGADRYAIDVHSAYGEKLANFTAPGGASSAAWPSGVPAPRPGTLIWRIRALALDRVLAESRPIAFEAR